VLHEVKVSTSRGVRLITIDDAYISSLPAADVANGEGIALFLATYVALLSDSPLGPKPPRVYAKFLASFQANGVKPVVIRFANLSHKLVEQLSLDNATSIGAWIPEFMDTPVFHEYHRFFQTGDVTILRFLFTFLSFGKKQDYKDESFNEAALRGWRDTEQRLTNLELDRDLLHSLRSILTVCLPPFTIEDFRPKFGPGAVAERGVRGRIAKVGSFAYDPVIDWYFFHATSLCQPGREKEVGLTPEAVLPDPTSWDPDKGVSSRVARLTFVPKNVKVARSICMEPSVLMYFQQGMLLRITELLRTSVIGRSVRLTDQTYNQKLAFLGSFSGLIDTLDLSSASDSVSSRLVAEIFPASWSGAMFAARSEQVILPGNVTVTPEKFAPMGSALCFPVQCIVFWAVCMLSACFDTYEKEGNHHVPLDPDTRDPLEAQGERLSSFNRWLSERKIRAVVNSFVDGPYTTLVQGEYQPLGVYGDDLCVDARLTHKVKSILSLLGFVVNHEKSFTNRQAFRESCGSYFVGGHDVKPLYYTIKGVREVATPEHIASHTSLTNECWDRGFKATYRFLRQSLLKWRSRGKSRNIGLTWNPIPFTSDPNTFGIRCKSPKNNHLLKRYNTEWQRDEIRCWQILYTEKYSVHDVLGIRNPYMSNKSLDECRNLLGAVDKYELVRWWTSRNVNNHEALEASKRYDTGLPGLRWRWIPVE
jgi:hypothetical protein